ncbi:MAG: glycoside hydrolase family 2 TIM barrel-domain containing protein [Bacteroidota bacterium]|nr:glycoside hydrolase family 2 TIM barrel-domain containing protein [Bacteroidota bacterium]
MKKFTFFMLFTVLFFSAHSLGAMKKSTILRQKTIQNTPDSVAGAPIPKEIEDPLCLGINKEPAHATLMDYGSLAEALKANRHASSFCQVLNGMWKFNYVPRPEYRPVDFYKPDYDVSKWKEIPVPSNWQVLGYGTPYYRNNGYTFQKDFPRVMTAPTDKRYTSNVERNPVGSYRRDFEVPQSWNGRRLFLTFDGVDAGFFLWINGEKVGYSVNSRNAAEFDVTKYVKPGKNTLAVEVYRYCTGSYLEDQDMWRLSGIFRNVTLWSTPDVHVRDFFVKTDLDTQYKDATVEVVSKIKNYGDKPAPAQKITATLYDKDKEIQGANAVADVPALNPGQEVAVTLSFPVKNPNKWTAETPYLYTTVINLTQGAKTSETLSSRNGFRKIEIKGRIFMVNGVPIKLKGANRHENWPTVGHAITEDMMIKDLVMLKQGNCNHVRTCHYSDDPRWYELCDEWGIWLVAEANVECHGYDRRFDNEPLMRDAIIDRNVANVENFKNHPSVIIWSLGNENGGIGKNFVDAMNTIKAIDPTRYVHYQRFGIGAKNPADMDSEMYTGIDKLEKVAKDSTYTKPFYLCEYAHAMFNSMGAIGEYNDLFDKYPSLLGGAIWEWEDQGIYNMRDPKHPIIAYGGGFGEFPNDHYFIHKGVIFSDRTPKPHYPEMKKAYQWIGVTPDDLNKGLFKIRNKYQFITLDGYSASWTLSENGKNIASGKIALPTIAPLTEQQVKIPYAIAKPKPGAEYYLRVSFTQNKDELWAKKGFEVASAQFKVGSEIWTAMNKTDNSTVKNPLTLSQNDKEITLKGNGFTMVFDKTAGTFTRIQEGTTNLLTGNGGPRLHLWRAPHRNDDMWAARDWDKNGLRDINWTVLDLSSKQSDPSTAQITVKLKGEGKSGFVVNHDVVYTIKGDGTITADNNVTSSNPQLVVARMGVRLMLDKQLDKLTYFGRGPMENYADRKRGFDVNVYSSTVKEQQTPYEKPMDCGNHEDVRWAKVTSANGMGLHAISDQNLMQITVLPYTDEELDLPEYKIDLPASSATVMCISHQTLGVGSAGCGPRPLPQYTVYAAPASFTYTLKMLPAL